MQPRKLLFFFFSLVAALTAACVDPPPSDSDTQARKPGNQTKVERRLAASRHLVVSSDEHALASATDMATALDIPAEMVKEAHLTSPGPGAAGVIKKGGFGVIQPRRGDSMVVLSTGRILDGDHLPEPGSDFAPTGTDGDVVTLRLTVNVPLGMNRLSFDYNFLSAEWPEFKDSEFNDTFTARVKDTIFGERVVTSASVNASGFEAISDTLANGTGFHFLFSDDPDGIDDFSTPPPPKIPLFPDSGITDFRSASAEVASGGLVTLEFDIRDQGDGALDSTVVIDNITFSSIDVVDVNPDLIQPLLGTVTTNTADLAVKGSHANAVAADGVTQVLLRVKLPKDFGPGQMQFTLLGAKDPADRSLGAIRAVDGGVWSNSVTVDTQKAMPGNYAFALYTSPEDFASGGHERAITRIVSIATRYISASGFEVQGKHDLTIVRPPVVIVHNIWSHNMVLSLSSCSYWKEHASIYKDKRFEATCIDYYPSDSLASKRTQEVVPNSVYQALKKLRDRGTAVTQVDAIAHGTGGLLTRKIVDLPTYFRSENFNKGDLNRLITINTPHLGTRMANAIVEMRTSEMKVPTKWDKTRNSLSTLGIDINPGAAIDDLQNGSDFIKTIGETQVPSHVMVSLGGRNLSRDIAMEMLFDHIKVLYTNVEFKHPSNAKLSFIYGKTSKLFCSDDHDLFVPESDQKGGVVGTAVNDDFVLDKEFPETEHFKLTRDIKHNSVLADLLNSPINSELFAPSIPSPAKVTPVDSCNGGAIAASVPSGDNRTVVQSSTREAKTRQDTSGSGIAHTCNGSVTSCFTSTRGLSQSGLRIVSPSPGTPVFPGTNVMVQVEATEGFQPAVVFVTGGGQAVFFESSPFVAEFAIPARALGTIELVAFGFDEQGEMLESNPVVLPVVSSATLLAMEVLNGDAVLQGPGSTRQLVVLGNYDDGLTRDISASKLGTVYSSSNTNIATVTRDGMVMGRSPGRATITMRNGVVFTSITVTVSDNNFSQCIQVRLGDHTLLVLEDYTQGHYIGGRVAAGGNISLQDFSVGSGLSDTDTGNVLVAGGDIALSRGGIWGDIRYGGKFISDTSVNHLRGTASPGTPIDFAALGGRLRTLSSRLATIPATGTTTLAPSWGGILLHGTEAKVNVFEVNANAFQGATLFSIDAPAGSLAVINVRGTSATLSSFGQSLSGGIDEHGVLLNFPDATSLTASGYGFQGTILAPLAHVAFNDGSWSGGLYARSLTGNASGYINRLRDTDICL